jgi:hypothetical protein
MRGGLTHPFKGGMKGRGTVLGVRSIIILIPDHDNSKRCPVFVFPIPDTLFFPVETALESVLGFNPVVAVLTVADLCFRFLEQCSIDIEVTIAPFFIKILIFPPSFF